MREKARSKNRKARQQLEEQIDTLLEAEMEAVPRPQVLKLWPIQLVLALVLSVLNVPQAVRRKMEEKEEKRRLEEEEKKRMEEEESKPYFSYLVSYITLLSIMIIIIFPKGWPYLLLILFIVILLIYAFLLFIKSK